MSRVGGCVQEGGYVQGVGMSKGMDPPNRHGIWDTTRYGWQADSTHLTGMLSCSKIILQQDCIPVGYVLPAAVAVLGGLHQAPLPPGRRLPPPPEEAPP